MSDELNNSAVKIAGDYHLHIRGIPYDDMDSDRQWFDKKTELMLDTFREPLIADYHGIGQGMPNIPGKAEKVWVENDGVWVDVLLDKKDSKAQEYWDSAKKGKLAASSGSIAHIARLEIDGKLIPYSKDKPGRIAVWPFAELSLIDQSKGQQPANKRAIAYPALKAVYEQAGIELPELQDEPNQPQADISAESEGVKTHKQEKIKMEKEVKEVVGLTPEQVQAQIESAFKAQAEKAQKEAEAKKAEQERIDAEVAKQMEAFKAEQAKARRLPSEGQAPYATKFHGLSKYDNIDSGDLALGIEILNGAASQNRKVQPAAKAMYQALAIRAFESTDKTKEEKEVVGALKAGLFAAGAPALKADEIMQQDLTSYGDEWVGQGYGTRLWEQVRIDADGVLAKLPQVEIPQGYETFYDPIEGSDPVWYKVAETTDENSTTKTPNASVTSSRVGTGRVNETLAKAGARVQWSGELDEDSLIPALPELRRKLVISGREQLAHIVIDGDTATGATTNINDIGGTPAGTESFLLVNGLRKLALVTNTANARSAAGSFKASDFIETVKLMGLGGKNAMTQGAVSFIIDAHTMWKSLELPEVKTRDVFAQPTIEKGQLRGIYGYDVMPTPFMHFANQDATYGLKANSAGKVDLDTAANNLYGAILAVRWDQWKFGWKRRMTLETERIARADVYEIVALMRFGLKYRDNEASAITYYVGV